MSRRRKALVAAAFTYAQSFLGILASFFITRLLVRALGPDLYGIWLATGGLLAYAALADLGIFGVMPWLFAEADGEKNVDRMRGLLAHGLWAGAAVGVAYVAVASVLWLLLPRMAQLTPDDIQRLRGPIFLIVVATAVSYPFRLFSALLGGLQDFKFLGAWQIVGTLLNAVLSYVLLRAGFGLYAVAIASIAPPVLVSAASLARTVQSNGHLLRALPRATIAGMKPILSSGAGSWIGMLGWQMAFATDAIVLAFLGYRSLVPTFVITSRLGLTLMQFAWSLPDSALIGLANLGAEGDRTRTSSAVRTLIRLNLLPIGAIACATLAANALFVRVWVGTEMYGGFRLNVILTLDVVVLSVVHAILTPAAVLGSRLQVGAITVANGAAHIVFALVLGRWFGLCGVAAATALSALVTSIPVGARLLAERTGITARSVFGSVVLPWGARALPCALFAAVGGWAFGRSGAPLGGRGGTILLGGATAGLIVSAYLWSVKSIMRGLPFGPRLTKILSALHLI
jgi:O-antigen/teichoic acid export membrane protein